MSTDALVAMLLANLEIVIENYDEEGQAAKRSEMETYLTAAQNFIAQEGITLDLESVSDCLLVVMYASWLYDKRRAPENTMPRMLRWNLNNRLMSQKMQVSNES